MVGALVGLLLLADGRAENRPRSAAASPEDALTVLTVPPESADSAATVVVARDQCSVAPGRTIGPDVTFVIDNRDRLDAVISVGLIRAPTVSGGSKAEATLPLGSGRVTVTCSLIPAHGATPVAHGTTSLEVIT